MSFYSLPDGRDDSNWHIQHLNINNDHVVLSLSNDLEFFKQVYFRLIDETNKILKKLDRSKDKESHKKIYELLEALSQTAIIDENSKNVLHQIGETDMFTQKWKVIPKKTLWKH